MRVRAWQPTAQVEKITSDLGGVANLRTRGVVSVQDRKKIVALVDEVTQNRKLPLLKALDCVGISTTRYYQWKKAPDADDKRTHPNRRGIVTNPQPERALSQEERQVIVNALKDPKYSDHCKCVEGSEVQ